MITPVRAVPLSFVSSSFRSVSHRLAAAMAHTPTVDFLRMVPSLDGSNHKGQHGKVSVIGGSVEFTGAPYYAAFAAMQVGADYGNVFCSVDAGVAIKSYAPELIVHACMPQMKDVRTAGVGRASNPKPTQEQAIEDAMCAIRPWMDKSSCLVIGPGLGKDMLMLAVATQVLSEARSRNLPCVIDADGLGLLTSSSQVDGYNNAVLTPNAPELWRLADMLALPHRKPQPHEDPDFVAAVAAKLNGPVLLAKGARDTVCGANMKPRFTVGPGCPRRCGGQGDILAGTIATTTSWAVAFAKQQGLRSDEEGECIAAAVIHGAEVVRDAQHVAFKRRGRSMVATDVLNELQSAVSDAWPLSS